MNPNPRSRSQFGKITKLLGGNTGYLLGWSDENKQIGGEDAMKLGAPLASADNLALLHLTCKLFTNKFKNNSIVSIQTGLMQACMGSIIIITSLATIHTNLHLGLRSYLLFL